MGVRPCVLACVRVYARACIKASACVRTCVRACVRACERARATSRVCETQRVDHETHRSNALTTVRYEHLLNIIG